MQFAGKGTTHIGTESTPMYDLCLLPASQIERTTDKALVLARIRDFCEDALEGGEGTALGLLGVGLYRCI